ncbi:unnamed protein product [Lepidochelys kempii]
MWPLWCGGWVQGDPSPSAGTWPLWGGAQELGIWGPGPGREEEAGGHFKGHHENQPWDFIFILREEHGCPQHCPRALGPALPARGEHPLLISLQHGGPGEPLCTGSKEFVTPWGWGRAVGPREQMARPVW